MSDGKNKQTNLKQTCIKMLSAQQLFLARELTTARTNGTQAALHYDNETVFVH